MSTLENHQGITGNRTPDLGESLFAILSSSRKIKRMYAKYFDTLDHEVADQFWRIADQIEGLADRSMNLIVQPDEVGENYFLPTGNEYATQRAA